MYLFMTLPVQFQTFILITIKIYPSTFVLFYMYTDVPVHHYTCSVYLFFFGITCTMTFQLIYRGTYKQIHLKINRPVYRHVSLSSNHKKRQRFYCSTCSQMYLFITILFCMSTDVPDHLYACSVYFFFFGITCAMTFQLIYLGSYTHIYPKIILPFYLHASLPSNHKDLPVSTATCVPAQRCTCS